MRGFDDFNKNKPMNEPNEETYVNNGVGDNIDFNDTETAYPDVSYPEGGGRPSGRAFLNGEMNGAEDPYKSYLAKKAEKIAMKAEEKQRKKEMKQALKEEKRKNGKPSFLMNFAKFRDDLREKRDYKRAHKDEIRAEKIRRKEERREDVKRHRMERKAEKIALRNERKALLAEKKAERRALYDELRVLKRTDKSAYRAKRAEIKQAKRDHRIALKTEKARYLAEMRAKGIRIGRSKGMLAAVISLAIVLGVVTLGMGALAATTTIYMNRAENAYNKAYYQLIMDMNNLETSLTKVMAEKSPIARGSTLNEVSALAVSAENNLTSLPTENAAEAEKISKFFNQVMDYSKYLANKLYAGNALTETEESNLNALLKVNTALKDALNQGFEESIASGDRLFSEGMLLRSTPLDPLSSAYSVVSEGSINYPTLIYDGPFSDNKADAELRLATTEISEDEARLIAGRLMDRMTEMEAGGEIVSDNLSAYSFTGCNETDEMVVQVAKSNGMVILVDAYRAVDAKQISVNDGVNSAKEYVNKLGYKNVAPVWKNVNGNVLTVNFAESVGDTVVYSRLVKVTVALDNGEVLGMEGATYAANSSKSVNVTPKLSETKARAKVSGDLYVTSSRLAVIPMNSQEILTYEFAGNMNGMTFYVYIDANSGAELKVLRVIENEQQGQVVL